MALIYIFLFYNFLGSTSTTLTTQKSEESLTLHSENPNTVYTSLQPDDTMKESTVLTEKLDSTESGKEGRMTKLSELSRQTGTTEPEIQIIKKYKKIKNTSIVPVTTITVDLITDYENNITSTNSEAPQSFSTVPNP